MKIKIDGVSVDVLDARCATRGCFQLGFDKGSFSQGRGYTSYHAKEHPVCMTRHLRGCPSNSVCPLCRTCSVDAVGVPCSRPECTGTTEARDSR